jgi:hypothetical protein
MIDLYDPDSIARALYDLSVGQHARMPAWGSLSTLDRDVWLRMGEAIADAHDAQIAAGVSGGLSEGDYYPAAEYREVVDKLRAATAPLHCGACTAELCEKHKDAASIRH